MTFRNDVYDLTKYLAVHPGGPKLLLDKAGRDLTEDFDIAHGRNNSRVASMLLPYRIGTLNTYTCRSCTNNNSNSNLQTVSRLKECIMDQWSVPLLHTVLEHRSVFLLDVNRFDSLWEPPSHTVFKSQIDQPGGLTSVVVDKFLTQYEPDLFKTVLNAVGADKLGAAVKAIHCCDDQGVVPSGVGIVKKERADDGDEMMFPDFEAVQRTIKQFRTVQIGNHNFQRKSPELSLDRCSRFLNYLVATCVEMQQTVEMALKDASKEGNFKHACTMLSNLIRIMSDGIERAYTVLAVNRLTFNWR